MYKQIPNTLTGINILLGSIAIPIAFYDLQISSLIIILAAVLDFFDGATARWLNARSELGKQLDSLADMICFGVAPSIIIYLLLMKSNYLPELILGNIYVMPFVAFILPLCAGIRLAKYNIQITGTGFYGLPTPASALFIISLPLILIQDASRYHWIQDTILNFYVLISITIVISGLMISRIRMISLKFHPGEIRSHIFEILLILFSIGLLIIFYYAAIPMIILLYVFLSIIKNIIYK